MSRRTPSVAAVLLPLLVAACASRERTLPEPQLIPEPDPAAVEHVFFLVGDAGNAHAETYPILTRLRQDIEWWAERLPADSAVTVVFLGDNVYPLGLHAPDHEAFANDTSVLMDQVRLLAGPAARARGARGLFVAGNHDWGRREEFAGFVRIQRMDDFLASARDATGAYVQLAPAAGTGGPFVADIGRHVRLVLLDTAWWLLSGVGVGEQQVVLDSLATAFQTAGARHLILAAHHPSKTAGPHGGEVPVWRTLGVRALLMKSGAILQDLSSAPYRNLSDGLRQIYRRTRVPLAFVGGHDHSLQVFRGLEPTDPSFSIVSGSASKLSGLRGDEGMLFGRSAPGYMRLVIDRSGGASLYVVAAPREYLRCPEDEPERTVCMTAGVAAYEVVHSQRLR